MACSYIIKLPNSGEVLVLPTNFGHIEESNKNVFDHVRNLGNFTKEQLEEYQNTKLKEEDLSGYLKDINDSVKQITQNISNDTPLNGNLIRNTIKSNITGDFIGAINSKIDNLGSIKDVETAIRQ
jgi:uncharacterized protein YoxC